MAIQKKRYTRSGKRKTNKKQKGGQLLKIQYNTNVNKNIKTKQETQKEPIIQLFPFELSTLLVYDPNAIVPSYIHYLVINIPNGDITKGHVVLPYVGPSPPSGSGTHQYIFNQYQQSQPMQVSIHERSRFNVKQFETMYNLNLKGSNYFSVVS